MAINWVDRVATHPGRVQLTPVQGQTNIYDMERADEPTVAGTPVNAANLNAMQKNMGLDANKTVYVAVSGSDSTGNGSSTAPYQTITKALSTIPKNLNGYLATINIGAGTYNEGISLNGYNGGEIVFTGTLGDTISIKSIRLTESNNLRVVNINIAINGSGFTEDVFMRGSTMYCHTRITMSSAVAVGVFATIGSTLYINEVTVSQKTESAIRAETGSTITIQTIGGSNNEVGCRAVSGGTIYYGTYNMSAKLNYFTAVGGRIYSGSQTSIPNY